MKLEIEYKDSSLDRKFGNWLILIIQKLIQSSINDKKLLKWDKYISENFNHLYSKKVTSKDIILAGIKDLVCDDTDSKLIIKISTNHFIQGLDRVRIETLCRLINYGNTEIKGYPIFTDTFDDIADNISVYVRKYLEETHEWQ